MTARVLLPAQIRAKLLALPRATFGPGILEFADDVATVCTRFELNTPRRLAMFLGQAHHETGGFRILVESLNYTPERLLHLFSTRRISIADAQKFGRGPGRPAHQNALANILYGGDFGRRELGNTQPGDGWRFRGRGIKQLTGRANYRAFGVWFKNDGNAYLINPDSVASGPEAVGSAVWFWTARPKLVAAADAWDVPRATRVINGGQIGLGARSGWCNRYLQALQ